MKVKDIEIGSIYMKDTNTTRLYRRVIEIKDKIVMYEEFDYKDNLRRDGEISLISFARWVGLKCSDNWIYYLCYHTHQYNRCRRCECDIAANHSYGAKKNSYYRNELNHIVLCCDCIEFKKEYE
jgi:hypothetical protein